MHLSDNLVPLGPNFANKVNANKLVSLHDLRMGLFLRLLEIFLSSLDFLLQGALFHGVLGRVELLVKGPQLVIPDRCYSPKGFLYVILHLLLLQKLLDSNDMLDVALVGPGLE
jgi:hypothetical protein